MYADASRKSSLELQSGTTWSQIGNRWSFYTKLPFPLHTVLSMQWSITKVILPIACPVCRLLGKSLQGEALFSTRSLAFFPFSKCAHTAPLLCRFPTGTATAAPLPKGLSRRGVTTCPVLSCILPKHIMASVIGICLLFVSL